MENYFYQYSTFVTAKNIGVKFSPHDLTIEQLQAFGAIESEIRRMKEEESKRG